MTLTDYLAKHKISDAEFAEQIGVSRQAVHRYRNGERIPDRSTMARIMTVTGGKVSADDFFEPAQAAS